MRSPGSISERDNLHLNLLNFAFFLVAAFSGSVIQIKYHMHLWPSGLPVIGLDRSGWVLLHKASAVVFLAGIVAHSTLNWRFISAITRKVSRRLRPSAPLSYWLFLVCIPTCLTAMISWILFGRGEPARFLFVESHDKLGWLLIILAVIHIVSRAGRMTKAYRKLNQGGRG